MNKYVLGCLALVLITLLPSFSLVNSAPDEESVARVLKESVLQKADWALKQEPITITAFTSPRSAGGPHDFFSEGDYWWPDPKDPSAPYIQKDGLTNPGNFVQHRLMMIRFSEIIGALASAFKLTGDQRYVNHALLHLRAWFVNPETRMNPNLQFAQAIQGRFTGRGIGIIDTIHLMEVAQGVLVMEGSDAFPKEDSSQIRNWFANYLDWLTSHPYGKDEMNAKNNHGTCWVMQVAAFAKLTRDQKLIKFCIDRFKNVLLPDQMAANGGFPLELKRTKPFGYSIFNLDAMATICQILSDQNNNLWEYSTADGRSVRKGIEFLYPYVVNKDSWPFQKDVMYWNNWPVAQPFLVFGAVAFKNTSWFNTWKSLDHSPSEPEVIRNLPIRNPLIWL